MTEPASDPAPFDGPVVSVIAGDRLCTRCGFNLTGQEVVREGRYRLFVVRCPECGTVASLQEYPALNRWAGRWATVLAATWLIALAGLLFLTTIAATAPLFGSREIGADDYGRGICQAYADSQGGGSTSIRVGGQTIVYGSYSNVDLAWWRSSGARDIIRAGRSSIGMISNGVWGVWLSMTPVMFLAGSVWAVVLLRLSAPKRILFLVLPFAIGSTIYLGMHVAERPPATGVVWGRSIAHHELGLVLYGLTQPFLIVPAIVGVLVGRKLTRGLMCALLTPRLLAPFTTLWLADGKPVPVSAARRP